MKNLLRNLFYACGIVAALAVVGHELSGTARATGGANRIAWRDETMLITEAGDLYNKNGGATNWVHTLTLPVADLPIWAMPGTYEVHGEVVLVNGDVWKWDFGPPQLIGNVFGPGPTVVTPSTWSEIKGRLGR